MRGGNLSGLGTAVPHLVLAPTGHLGHGAYYGGRRFLRLSSSSRCVFLSVSDKCQRRNGLVNGEHGAAKRRLDGISCRVRRPACAQRSCELAARMERGIKRQCLAYLDRCLRSADAAPRRHGLQKSLAGGYCVGTVCTRYAMFRMRRAFPHKCRRKLGQSGTTCTRLSLSLPIVHLALCQQRQQRQQPLLSLRFHRRCSPWIPPTPNVPGAVRRKREAGRAPFCSLPPPSSLLPTSPSWPPVWLLGCRPPSSAVPIDRRSRF